MKYPLSWCSTVYFLLLFSLSTSCGNGKSAEDYAERFCSCSVELAKANIQLDNKLISPEAFREIEAEQEACMGEDDPLKDLDGYPDKEQQFQFEFIQALEKKCPAIARDMGF